ncbi:MAG: hypothetical protein Q9209_007733 [Squamulea sp. 1 TL-2023]
MPQFGVFAEFAVRARIMQDNDMHRHCIKAPVVQKPPSMARFEITRRRMDAVVLRLHKRGHTIEQRTENPVVTYLRIAREIQELQLKRGIAQLIISRLQCGVEGNVQDPGF